MYLQRCDFISWRTTRAFPHDLFHPTLPPHHQSSTLHSDIAHMHACTHTHMHACTHTHMHTYTHAHIHTCTRTNTRVHMLSMYCLCHVFACPAQRQMVAQPLLCAVKSLLRDMGWRDRQWRLLPWRWSLICPVHSMGRAV